MFNFVQQREVKFSGERRPYIFIKRAGKWPLSAMLHRVSPGLAGLRKQTVSFFSVISLFAALFRHVVRDWHGMAGSINIQPPESLI